MMLYAAGFVYVLVYFAVCWKRPQIALMLIFALAPFQNDIGSLGKPPPDPNDPLADMGGGGGGGGGPHFSMAEINLMLAAILFILKRRPLLFGPALGPTIAYFIVCIASSLLHWHDSTTTSMFQMGLYMIVAVSVFTSLGRDEKDYRLAYYGLMLIGCILSAAVIITRSGYVLGLHKNGVGGSLSASVIVAAELWLSAPKGKWKHIAAAVLGLQVAGLFFCLSRGGWIGAGVGVALILIWRRDFATLARVLIAFIPLICICWYFLDDKSRDYTTGLSSKNVNIQLRYRSVEFARMLFDEDPYLGMGVGWRKDYDATNLFWLTLAETGVAGCVTFFAINIAVVNMAWHTSKRLSTSDPLFSAVVIGGGELAGRMIHGMVDHYWSRGAITVAWAGVGMATYGYLIVRQRQALVIARQRAAMYPTESQAELAA